MDFGCERDFSMVRIWRVYIGSLVKEANISTNLCNVAHKAHIFHSVWRSATLVTDSLIRWEQWVTKTNYSQRYFNFGSCGQFWMRTSEGNMQKYLHYKWHFIMHKNSSQVHSAQPTDIKKICSIKSTKNDSKLNISSPWKQSRKTEFKIFYAGWQKKIWTNNTMLQFDLAGLFF